MRSVEARGCNHSLQVYKQATEHPRQGNITRMPMSSKTLNGLVSKHDRKELQGVVRLALLIGSMHTLCSDCLG